LYGTDSQSSRYPGSSGPTAIQTKTDILSFAERLKISSSPQSEKIWELLLLRIRLVNDFQTGYQLTVLKFLILSISK
jgi:hypothetical protein